METRIKFGVFSTGLVAPFYIKAIRTACSAELVGVCNPNRASADAMAAEYGCRTFYDLTTMLPEIDAVCITTPNHMHVVAVLAAVDAWIHNLAHPKAALENSLLAFLDFSSGAKGVVEASTALWPGKDLRIELNSSNGTAIMTGESITTWQFKDEWPEDAAIRTTGDPGQATTAGSAAQAGRAELPLEAGAEFE
jgi:predicted dehydrogenase